MNVLLTTALSQMNRIRRLSNRGAFVLRFIRAALIALVTLAVWSIVRPEQELAQFGLSFLVFVVVLVVGLRKRENEITKEDFLLSLEMKHPETSEPSFVLKEQAISSAAASEWNKIVESEVVEYRKHEVRRNMTLASSLVIPLLLSFLTFPSSAPSLKMALSDVVDAVTRLSWGVTLQVLEGAATDIPETAMELSRSNPLELELLSQNMVEVRFVAGRSKTKIPILELRHINPIKEADGSKRELYQSFQMSPLHNAEEEDAKNIYSISFAISEDVKIFIPMYSSDPLAIINVKQLPVPKVRLSLVSKIEEPWPDDRPLNLDLSVTAENPLRLVRLKITTGGRTFHELVANVLTEDKHEVHQTYHLVLEPYLEQDISEVEIVAEAIDRSIPTPLVGLSEPIKLTTASAYGRYRQTLQTLKTVKSMVDDSLKKRKGLDKEAAELAEKASKQAERSPFFDGLDRVKIHEFVRRTSQIDAKHKTEELLELADELNHFLFEHEILDDRERDRDFFVAARALSRLIERDKSKRTISVPTVTDRMKLFLDSRHKRWTLRTKRLPKKVVPKIWRSIRTKKPFHGAMSEIAKNSATDTIQSRSDSLRRLSKAVVDYRSWIDKLETAEDKFREEQEQKRQKGLASARSVLKELQKRQDTISQTLDRAGQKKADKLAEKWPSARMKQNKNIKATRRFEGQLRSLSPKAGARVSLAMKSMKNTVSTGNKKNFVLAESSSDMAARLLRQAESATKQSQNKRKSRGRRRRVTGDNYYGQPVVGGDIEIQREYQVDRRYREDILDEVLNSTEDKENRVLLDNYLRRVIR